MSTPPAGSTAPTPQVPQRSHSSPPAFNKGKWVSLPPTIEPPRIISVQTSPSPLSPPFKPSHQPTLRTANIDLNINDPLPTLPAKDPGGHETLKTRISTTLHALFPCFLSTRPKYTKIQHLIIPTSQICINAHSLRFLQLLPREKFHLLNYIVQEVFTDDGVKVLGRIPDYDDLIEKGLKGVVKTAERPWVNVQREGYVESLAGLYARLLKKMGTYERAQVCERVYERKYRKKGKGET
ncbi:hypothetical protein TWF694_007537 [Orbilia ellipsospora]|uniref:Uncharacterized protein n=1 Tax=Orbilia ellipsospora TaxID=2528407 RepID=A0AAV9XI25_9PEZI